MNKPIKILLISLLAFTPVAYGAGRFWAVAIFEVVAAGMAVFWILKDPSSGKARFTGLPILLLFFSLISMAVYQLVFSGTLYVWATKTELLKLIAYVLIFAITLDTFKTRTQIGNILAIMITIGFIMSLLFLMRYFNVPLMLGFRNPDHFSAYLGMVIPLALGLTIAGGRRPLLFFTVIIMSAALFLTLSRGGMISFTAALLVMALAASTRKSLKHKKWIFLTVAVFIVLMVIWLGATPVVERLLSVKAEITSRYFGGRLPIWEGTLGIINDHPAFGTGLGTFNYVFPQYQPASIIMKHFTYAHSDFLELLSETGLIFFFWFLICGVWSAGYLIERFYARHDPWVTGLSIGFFGSLTAIFIHSFVDFNLHMPANAILLSVILALFVAILKSEREEPSAKNDHQQTPAGRNWAKRGIAFAGIILIVIYTIAAVRPALADHYAAIPDPGLKNIEYAIKLDPSNAAHYYELGEQQGRLRKYDLQIKAYEKAIELQPTNSRYHQSLAWACGQMAIRGPRSGERSLPGRSQYARKAHEHFNRAIDLEPNFSQRYRAYAMWLFDYPVAGNIKKAVTLYRKAVEMDPSLADEALKKYRGYQNDHARLYEILPETGKNDERIFSLVMKEKGLAFAMDFAKGRLKTYSDNAAIHFKIASNSFYDENYQWEFTLEHYRIALENDPADGYYRMYYGIHLCFRKEYAAALENLERSVELGLHPVNMELAQKYIAVCKNKINSGSSA